MMRLILAPKPTKEIDKKTQIAGSEIGPKIPPKIIKIKKTLQHKIGHDLTQKHGYIDANEKITWCENHHNILPLFTGLEGSLTFSLPLSYTMKHTHTSQKETMARGWERDG
jgi:hypothetical protein